MATVNIGSVKDDFYRYKMPAPQAKVEGRGNGIKTVIPNMSEIAEAIARPLEYPLKFLGMELGAQSRYNPKIDKAVVNGAHTGSDLLSLLKKFINSFVLCSHCGNPETDLEVDKNEMIHLHCKACGLVTDVSPAEKLYTYIVKHPPARLDAERAELTGKGRRRTGMHAESSGFEVDDSEMSAVEHPVKRLQTFVQEEHRTMDQVYMELISIQDEYGLSWKEIECLIFEGLILVGNPLVNAKTYGSLIPRLCGDDPDFAQKIVMRYLSRLLGMDDGTKTIHKLVPHVLKALWDEDAVTEDFLLRWHKRSSSNTLSAELRKAIIDFVIWLERANEDDDDEDEDDGDEEYDEDED